MPTTHHQLLLLLVPLGVLGSLRLAAPMISPAPSPGSTADANATAHHLLTLLGFPAGLLPGNVDAYTMSDDGEFTVELSKPCYIWFENLVYYDKTIRGRITYGRISGISGVQVRKFFIWVDITSVAASKGDGGRSIVFTCWIVSEKHPASEFLEVRPCEKTAVAHSSSSSSSLLQSGGPEGVASA